MGRHLRWARYQAREPRWQRWQRWLGDLRPDLAYAVRQLRRAPGMTALIVATLAIGIGANVTMAGVIDRLLLRAPSGVREPERVVRILFHMPDAPRVGGFVSYPALLEYQRDVPALDGLAGFTAARLPLGVGPEAPYVIASLVTANFFPVLGVAPALGRTFTPADGFPEGVAAGGPALAVLAHGLWQSEFGGDSAVLGRPLRIGKLTYTVVGVAPPHFRGLSPEQPDVWLPLTVAADEEVRRFSLEDQSMSWIRMVARIRPGVARTTVEAQATPVARRVAMGAGSLDTLWRVVAASVIPGRGPDAPREVKVALWLGAVSALVLLIACANVANLLLARAFTRRREIAVRLALGAGRGRLARQMLTEACVLTALGGAAALGVAMAGSGLVQRFFLSVADEAGTFVDARLFIFTAAIALGTGVLVSLAPLAQSAVPDLTHTLRTGGGAGGGRSSRARTGLLGAQAALCMLLLVVAGLFAQSLRRVQGLDLGFVPERTLRAFFSVSGAMTDAQRDVIYAELMTRVRAIPGVRDAALVKSGLRAVNVHTSARNVDEEIQRTSYVPYERSVDSNYFRVLGSSLQGRDFRASDVRGAPPVTIINEPLARLLFPDGDALGQCVYLPIRSDDPDVQCWTVVGVLRGFWYPRDILKRDGMLVYVPRAQRTDALDRPGQMVVSVSGGAAAIVPRLRNAILSVQPNQSRLQVQWLRDVIEPELRPWRLAATMFSIFGAIALVIAAVGLYAVVSFTASQRASEIAVRIALGARARNVLATVAGNGLFAVGVGLLVGLAAALGIRRWIGPLLFETSPGDPRIMLGVAALLLGVAVIAILVPTAQSLRRNPATLLRVE